MEDSQTVGILLPVFPQFPKKYSLENLMNGFMESDMTSGSAKDFLKSASPSRRRSDGNQKRLILVEGQLLPDDPHSEEVKRFALNKGWTQPSFEDALRIFPLITSQTFGENVRSLIFLHEPVKKEVVGISSVQNRIILTSHKAEPREGWFCKTIAFVFRSC